jgi:predicted HTH transcriptional regulator
MSSEKFEDGMSSIQENSSLPKILLQDKSDLRLAGVNLLFGKPKFRHIYTSWCKCSRFVDSASQYDSSKETGSSGNILIIPKHMKVEEGS